MRDLLLKADLPECWIPPAIVVDCRAILELYRDLREQHEGWIQRIRAVLFHHGCPDLGPAELTTATGRARLEQAATAHLTGTARYQVRRGAAHDRSSGGRTGTVVSADPPDRTTDARSAGAPARRSMGWGR